MDDQMRLVPVQVDVTEQDIADGCIQDSNCCAVAKGMRRRFKGALCEEFGVNSVEVDGKFAVLAVSVHGPDDDPTEPGGAVSITLPQDVQDRIVDFDTGVKIAPFSFTAQVPAYVAAMLTN